MPEELERRLNEVPEVHTDPFMDPNYESTDEQETVGTKKDVVRPGQEAAILLNGTNGSVKSYATWEHSNNISNRGLENGREGIVFQTKSIEHQSNANLREPGLQSAANMVLRPTSNDILPRNRGLCSSSCSTECATEKVWLYEDPSGKTQGPFLMSSMRKWNNDKHFPPNLRIWRKSQKKTESILLTDALSGNYHKHLLSSGGVHQSPEVSATKYCHAGGSNFKSPDSLWSNTKQYGGNLADVNDGFCDSKSQFGSPQADASNRPATYHGAMNPCGTQSYQVEEHPDTIVRVSLSNDSGRGYAPECSSWDTQFQSKTNTNKGWVNGADKNSRGSADEKELPEREKKSETRWATPQDQDRGRRPGKYDGCNKPSRSQINSREYDGWQHADSRTNTHRGCEMMPSASSVPDNITWEVEKRNMVAEQSRCSRGNETSASERRTNLIKDEGFGEKGNNDWEKLTERDRLRASDSQKCESWDRQPRNQTNSSGWPSWQHADSRKNAQQEKRIDSYLTVHTGWEAALSETNVHSCGWEIPDKSVVAEQSWNSRVNTNEISAKERPTNVCKDDSWGIHVGKDKNVSKKLTQRARSSADKWKCWDKPSQSQMNRNGWYSWQHADTKANALEKLMEKDHNAYNGWETTPSNNIFHRGSDWEIADKKGAAEQSWNSRVKTNKISTKERPTNVSKDDSWGVHVGKDKNVSKILTHRERSSADKWECWDMPSQSQMNSNGWDSWQHADTRANAPDKLMEKDHNSCTGWETTPSKSSFHRSCDWEIADKKGAAEQSWNSRGKFVEISASERPKDVSQDDSWVAHTEKDTYSGWNKASQEKSSKNSVWNELGQQDAGGSDPWDAAVKSALSKEICSREATGWGTSGSKNVNWNSNGPTTQTKQKGRWFQFRKREHDREDKGWRDHRSPRDKMEPERSGRRQFSRW